MGLVARLVCIIIVIQACHTFLDLSRLFVESKIMEKGTNRFLLFELSSTVFSLLLLALAFLEESLGDKDLVLGRDRSEGSD